MAKATPVTEDCPGLQSHYRAWIDASGGPLTLFLDQTRPILNELPVAQEQRRKLLTTLLARVSDPATTDAEGLTAEQARTTRAWTHLALAEAFAAQENRAGVLEQIELSLSLGETGLSPQSFREHGTLSGWNEDPEFIALYQRFEPVAQTSTP